MPTLFYTIFEGEEELDLEGQDGKIITRTEIPMPEAEPELSEMELAELVFLED